MTFFVVTSRGNHFPFTKSTADLMYRIAGSFREELIFVFFVNGEAFTKIETAKYAVHVVGK